VTLLVEEVYEVMNGIELVFWQVAFLYFSEQKKYLIQMF
jgi:hypothetical protein